MKIKELIEKLSKLDGEKTIARYDFLEEHDVLMQDKDICVVEKQELIDVIDDIKSDNSNINATIFECDYYL